MWLQSIHDCIISLFLNQEWRLLFQGLGQRFLYLFRYNDQFRGATILLLVFGIAISLTVIIMNKLFSGTVPYTKRRQVVLLDWDSEKRMGKTSFEKEKASFGDKVLPPNHPHSIRVQGIAHNIIEALNKDLKSWSENENLNDDKNSENKRHLESLEWEFIVVDDPMVTTICFLGGKIVVSTMLVEVLTSDAEIAYVIGHDVADVVARHANETVTKLWWVILLWCSIFLPFILCPFGHRMLRNILIMVRRLSFGGRMEMEASHIGMLLMASAGYDPRGITQLAEKIAAHPTLSKLISVDWSCDKKTLQFLTQVVKEAMGLYRLRQSQSQTPSTHSNPMRIEKPTRDEFLAPIF